MSRVGFEATTPVFERTKTFRALDLPATAIGHPNNHVNIILPFYFLTSPWLFCETFPLRRFINTYFSFSIQLVQLIVTDECVAKGWTSGFFIIRGREFSLYHHVCTDSGPTEPVTGITTFGAVELTTHLRSVQRSEMRGALSTLLLVVLRHRGTNSIWSYLTGESISRYIYPYLSVMLEFYDQPVNLFFN
jgi:hypothetical protein